MQIPLDIAIREQLEAYVLGNQSLDDFKDWLVGATWDLPSGNESSASALAIRIKHRMAEQSSGYCSEDEMKDLLRPLVTESVPIAKIH